MGVKCDILNCQKQHEPGSSVHRIPAKNLKIRNEWIQFIKLSRNDHDWEPNQSSGVCCHHFEEKHFCLPGQSSRRSLSRYAVPTKLHPDELQLAPSSPDDLPAISDPTESKPCYGTISYIQDVLDHTTVCVAAVLLQRFPKLYKSLGINIGIDDNASDEIYSVVQPSTLLRCDPSEAQEVKLNVGNVGRKRNVSVLESTPQNATPKRIKLDHPYSYTITPRSHARSLKAELKSARIKLKFSKVLSLRRDRRAKTLKALLQGMKHAVSDETATAISSSYSPVLKSLIQTANQNEKIRKTCGIRYTETMKKFAVTLHFYSPRAYRFLRTHVQLPHETTLASWMSSTDCGPGFNLEIIKKLGEARSVALNHYMDDTVLQLDEMAIKKDTPWNPRKHQFVGTIDYGTGCDLVDPPLASNALVVLLAGLAGGWKVPLGYIFTDKVNGAVQHNLVSKAIKLLDEQKFRIHAVISDGNSANVSMFKAFGVTEHLETLKCHFDTIPGINQNIHAIFDIVHMMKLWRNMLHQYKVILWRGNPVKWIYFEFLEQLQDHEIIRAANKLSPQHIHFENNRMRVKLAVQVFSSSVADAIDFCRDDLNLPQFKGSEHTTKFIRLIDSAFDILNSRNPCQPGYKKPLTISNWEDRKQFLLFMCEELKHMTTCTRKSRKPGKPDLPPISIWKSQRKRAVIGFVVSSHSIIAISENVLFRTEHPLKFLLTYRFCQDLIELLFNKIRSRLGGNNNPNVVEFENTMRKIWHQNLLKSSSTGNCIVQMEENDIPGGLLPLQRTKNQTEIIDAETDAMEYLDLPDMSTLEYSLFYRNCLVYISGNVVKSIRSKIHCDICVSGLYDRPEDALPTNLKKLIARKDLGGLIYSSLSVYKIVELTDKSFRRYIAFGTQLTTKHLDFKIVREVILRCKDLNLFPTLCTHFFDFDPTNSENHETVLVKAVVRQFLRIRLFDYGRKYRKKANATTKRQALSKSILFRNE